MNYNSAKPAYKIDFKINLNFNTNFKHPAGGPTPK